MGAILDWFDNLWSSVKAWKQRKAGVDVAEGDKLRAQLDAEAAELARRAGEGR